MKSALLLPVNMHCLPCHTILRAESNIQNVYDTQGPSGVAALAPVILSQ